MRMLSFVILTSWFTLSAIADVELSSQNYFKYLDYDNLQQTHEILEFDAKLIDVSQQILQKLTAENKLEKPNPKIGLILVYAGMFIANTNNGVTYNKINEKDLGDVSEVPATDKMLARQTFAYRLLQLARKLAPNDRRIVAWESSIKFKMEALTHGEPTQKTMNWVVDLVRDDVTFNLFNGLVLNNSHPFSLEHQEAMVAQADIMTGIKSPCIPFNPRNWFGRMQKCKTTKKTPFAYHGVMLLMGDAYLKLAQRYLDDDKRENDKFAKNYIKQAINAYGRPKAGSPMKIENALISRRKLAGDLKHNYNSAQIDNYFKTPAGEAIYQCYFCHQQGKGAEVFKAYDNYIQE